MKVLILTLLMVTSPAFAQKTISAQFFQSNIRPVLNGILSDFYQMISLFPDYPKEIIAVIDQIESLEEVREGLRTSCPRHLNEACRSSVDNLRNKLSLLDAKTLDLVAKQRPEHSLYLNSMVGMRLISEFQTELHAFKGKLDNSSFLMSAKLRQRNETYTVIKKLDELQILLSLAVVEFVPYLYKEEFKHFYFNFIHPIEVQITKNKNYAFFNHNINSLNFTINLMNMNLTKRNKKTPEGMGPFLSLIHNRWNSILRYYF